MKIELPQSEASEIPKVNKQFNRNRQLEVLSIKVIKHNIPLIENPCKVYVIIVFITSLRHITPSSCQISE